MKEIKIRGFLKLNSYTLIYCPDSRILSGNTWATYKISKKGKVFYKQQTKPDKFRRTEFSGISELERWFVEEQVYDSRVKLFEFDSEEELDDYVLTMGTMEELTS